MHENIKGSVKNLINNLSEDEQEFVKKLTEVIKLSEAPTYSIFIRTSLGSIHNLNGPHQEVVELTLNGIVELLVSLDVTTKEDIILELRKNLGLPIAVN